MHWSLFLLNHLTEDAIIVQAGEWPFSYSWILILIVVVAWMEPEDYQGMTVEASKVCKGTRYQNLWWVEEASQKMDCAIQF